MSSTPICDIDFSGQNKRIIRPKGPGGVALPCQCLPTAMHGVIDVRTSQQSDSKAGSQFPVVVSNVKRFIVVASPTSTGNVFVWSCLRRFVLVSVLYCSEQCYIHIPVAVTTFTQKCH